LIGTWQVSAGRQANLFYFGRIASGNKSEAMNQKKVTRRVRMQFELVPGYWSNGVLEYWLKAGFVF
jgi:hypothetical protein